jgi:hypothetical protein
VHVLERSPVTLTGRGAGIVLHPATVRWWRERDVCPLEELSAAMRRLRYLDSGGAVANRAALSLPRELLRRVVPRPVRSVRLEAPSPRCEVVGFEIDAGGVTGRRHERARRPARLRRRDRVARAADGLAWARRNRVPRRPTDQHSLIVHMPRAGERWTPGDSGPRSSGGSRASGWPPRGHPSPY